jgi:peptide-methionine (S)-S-oxide reductase
MRISKRPCVGLVMALFIGSMVSAQAADQAASRQDAARATFAGGCFWCMEEAFEGVGGIRSVTSGYTGGQKAQPSYEEVSAGETGHAEAVEVRYDPAQVSYDKLLEVFWRNIDPTVKDRQFCDQGNQYRAAIFYHDEEQRRQAEDSRKKVEATKSFKGPIVTQIVPASTFYPAEDYHQDFYKKNPVRYKFYKYNCGRAKRLEELWGAPGAH